VTCSIKIRLRKATTITDMYAALDLGQRTIRAVLSRCCSYRKPTVPHKSMLLLTNMFDTLTNILMTLSLNCKDAGDPVCTHTMYGETEEELLQNAKKHGIEVHDYTEESWNDEIVKNADHFRKLIKTS
jgi:hypothetical protein